LAVGRFLAAGRFEALDAFLATAFLVRRLLATLALPLLFRRFMPQD
jgi:hypothetical protein